MHYKRSSPLKLAVAAVILLWASIAATPAKAALVIYEFRGSVGEISASLLGANSALGLSDSVVRGDLRPTTFSGFYRFNPDTIAEVSSPQESLYRGAVSEFQFTINYPGKSLSYSNTNAPGTITPLNTITVVNDDATTINNTTFFDTTRANVDTYTVQMTASGDAVMPNGPAPSSLELGYLHFNSSANFFGVGGPFSSTSLPNSPPQVLTLGSEGQFRVFFSNNGLVTGTITHFNLVATPLPPAVMMFGAGLVALIGLGARNWRQKRDGLV